MSRTPNTSCAICLKPIYRRPNQISKGLSFYCSHACKGKSQQKLHKCAVIDCPNMICSRLHKKTCSRACANKQKIGLKYNHLGRPAKDKVKDLAALRRRVIEFRGNNCSRCGYNKLPILHIHHIIEKSKGGLDDINNLELVCPNCHAEEHYIRRNA
jgi:HNH endonuclease